MVTKVLQQPVPETHIVFHLPGRGIVRVSRRNFIVLHPPVEMEYIDPGIVCKDMLKVHTQDNIVTEQQDLCMGVPFMQPFCPGY